MKTGFIGIGNMGGAILESYASSTEGKEDRIMICDLNRRRCEELGSKFAHVDVAGSITDLVGGSEVVVLGVKPQGIEEVLDAAAKVWKPSQLLISMAAGVSLAWLHQHLGTDARIIRIMPNTPAMVGEGMIALCRDEKVSEEDHAKAIRILAPAGRVEAVAEDMIDCVIGVSGSSPAYTYMYIEALAGAAEKNGMDKKTARDFAAQAVLGAAKMVQESPESLQQLRINVCSPGGTTIEAVETLMKNGFMDKVEEGFQAAVDRSIEMTGEK